MGGSYYQSQALTQHPRTRTQIPRVPARMRRRITRVACPNQNSKLISSHQPRRELTQSRCPSHPRKPPPKRQPVCAADVGDVANRDTLARKQRVHFVPPFVLLASFTKPDGYAWEQGSVSAARATYFGRDPLVRPCSTVITRNPSSEYNRSATCSS